MELSGFDQYLPLVQEKWSELPAGSDASERRFSADLMSLSTHELLRYWSKEYDESAELRSWYRELYAPLFKGKRILEIGSGMGYDGIHFLKQGAHWHFSDIVEGNQALLSRLCSAMGLAPLGFLTIDALSAFDALSNNFDYVWANGSLIHIPFDLAAEECTSIIRCLKDGGRWIELAYPYERWAREGSPDFST